MPVYKDQKRGTWYVSVGYKNSESERCRTIKRGFATKKAASEWEMSFRYKKSKSMFKWSLWMSAIIVARKLQ